MAKEKISRRQFLTRSALGTVGAVGSFTGVSSIVSSCSSESTSKYKPLQSDIPVYIPEMGDKAIDGKTIRAGVIGCGSRGSGATNDFLSAGDGLTIVAMADIFEDRLEGLRKHLREKRNIEVPDDKIHYGFDAYKKVCEDPNVDVVIIATPSIFHADQTKYAIEKGKHVFCEKAAGIDPVSCRNFNAAIKQAQSKGLCIQTGAQRHHERSYIESYKRIREGQIGRITGGVVKWNQGAMTYRKRRPEWTDMEYMLRDFFSWNWLCGDHVIDQLVHNIDVFTWFSHLKPVSVVGMGSQLQRRTGDIFDNFSLDIVYEGGVRVNAQARQIDGCDGDVSETIIGTDGIWTSKDMSIRDHDGNLIWQYDFDAEKAKYKQTNPYVLEHMDLINHIRSGKSMTLEAETLVTSSLTGAMGRESAYTGKEYKWDDFIASNLSLMPKELHLGNVENFATTYVPPKMGKLAADMG
ncbi:Gfo/Idh/MocA family protein [Bacteroides sp. 519]|uniref:Gfo/Idh/MocA family protein n=1 Tax=Bacteroides sp. 519 TaxID=2302937 RepID=UPI0013D6B514|nr:Gfo/Idh/MocA family oxidoreductase [Bacteroides sp. 519]NDV60004.1 gfo/Idh/MocA family oxidoreductase [Bacteroides sp. 519]